MTGKKLRIDFSKTEERSNYNTKHMPEGLYKATITGLTRTEAQDGTTMLVYAFKPVDNPYRTRNFPYYCKLQQNQLWKLRDLLIAAGQSVPKKAIQVVPEAIIGKTICIELEDDNYNGVLRSTVAATYSVDVLADDTDTTMTDSFDDEDEAEEFTTPEAADEDDEEFSDLDDDDDDWDDDLPDEEADTPKKPLVRRKSSNK